MVFSFASDGRAFTNYSASCATNRDLMVARNMTGNQYRQYLQQNAVTLIAQDRASAAAAKSIHK